MGTKYSEILSFHLKLSLVYVNEGRSFCLRRIRNIICKILCKEILCDK